MDDQAARAKIASDSGAMIVIEQLNERNLSSALEVMLNSSKRKEILSASKTFSIENGANELTNMLCDNGG